MMKEFPFDFTAFTKPIEKLTELNIAKFEAAIEKQTEAAKELISLTEQRSKALAEVKDIESFTAFLKRQNEIAQETVKKTVEESKAALEEAKAYNEEVQKIIAESIEAVSSTPKKTSKKAA